MNKIASDAYALKMQITELTEKHGILMNCLKTEANGVTTLFGRYRLSYSERPGTVDYSKIPLLKNIDLDPYRKDAVVVCKLEFIGEIDDAK